MDIEDCIRSGELTMLYEVVIGREGDVLIEIEMNVLLVPKSIYEEREDGSIEDDV